MTFERFMRAILTAIPHIGSPLEQLLFGTKDDEKVSKIMNNIEKSDKVLRIKRDEKGDVINNPYDFGEI